MVTRNMAGNAVFKKKWGLCLAMVAAMAAAGCASEPPRKPNALIAQMARADQAYQQGHWLQAEQGYQAVVQAVPEDHYAWFRLGNTMLRQGRVETAIVHYHRAIENNPDEPKAHYNLGIAYLINALESMERSYRAMRERDPGRDIVYDRMMEVQRLIGQPLEIESAGIGRGSAGPVPMRSVDHQ